MQLLHDAARPALVKLALLALTLITFGAPLYADIIPLVERPIAPRGGVMMLPVGIDPQLPMPQPRVLDVTGRALPSRLAWFRTPLPDLRRSRMWSDDPRLATPVSQRLPDGGVLLIDLAGAAEGTIAIGTHLLDPIWASAAQPSIPDAFGGAPQGALTVTRDHHLPDPEHPLEHFRWVLLADELGMRPPDTSRFSPLHADIATATADLWRIGLARLARISPGVARTCRRALVHRVHDGDREIAAWVTDPQLLDELLRLLLDPARSERRLLGDALAWSDLVPPLVVWLDDHDPHSITLGIINRSPRPIDMVVAWEIVTDEPRTLIADVGRVTLHRIGRLRADAPGIAGRLRPDDRAADAGLDTQTIRIDAAHQTIRLDIPPAVERALPPGPVLGPFMPPVSLADLEQRLPPPFPLEHATSGELRYRQGRWELFFDCRRPGGGSVGGGGAGGGGEGGAGAEPVAGADVDGGIHAIAMLGREGLTIIIGPPELPYATLVIPEQGWWRLQHGTNDGSLQVHRRSLEDRWYCRIVLPAQWLRITERTPHAMFQAIRTHEGSPSFEVMPRAGLPWRSAHPSRLIDLVHWDDLP